MSRSSTIFTIASVTVLSGLVAYALYFDYRRRNDLEFRKKLLKEKKRLDKQLASLQEAANAANAISPDDLRAALAKIRTEDVPKTPEESEVYFTSHVGLGEQLATQGPAFCLPAALSFYRALRVYPQPVELIVIYQKTLPEPIFKIVMDLTNMDVSEDISFTPAEGSPRQSHLSEDDESSPTRTGPPSETSSQDWDKLTDPGSHSAAY